MKKVLPVIILVVFVWSCSKKMAPAQSGSSTSNSGSVTNTTQPMSPQTDPGKGTTTTTPTATVDPSVTTSSTGSKQPVGNTPAAAAAIAGQSTYNNKCGRCHGLKVTTDYTADRWISILAVMAPKANLTDTERENVTAYVKENSKK